MNLKKFIGLKVEIVQPGGFKYEGLCLSVTKNSIEVEDKFGARVNIAISSIETIREVMKIKGIDWLIYLDKVVKINLFNGYYYLGKVLNVDKKLLEISDIKGNFTSISKDDILAINEVKQ